MMIMMIIIMTINNRSLEKGKKQSVGMGGGMLATLT